MQKAMSVVLMIAGVLCMTFFVYEWYGQYSSGKEAMKQAKEVLAAPREVDEQVEREPFLPEQDEVVGILRIPKIDAELPIVEGTDEDQLAAGVGHFSTTAFPGEDEQILLSGHRDTVFRKFGDLEEGDRFIVEMPYGQFEYEMRSSRIVDQDNTSVIGPMGEEVLTLSTCYPFRYVGFAPDRYVIYAYPVDES